MKDGALQSMSIMKCYDFIIKYRHWWNCPILKYNVGRDLGTLQKSTICITALRPHCSCALGLLYMLKQLLSSSLVEVMKPGCPGNVESGETSLSWPYPQSIGSQCKIKDQRHCVWSKGPWKSLQVTLSIKNTWPSILGILVTDASFSCH